MGAQAVVKLFVDHYNKKKAETPLDAAALHIKIVGGDHLSADARVSDSIKNGDECYLLGQDWREKAAAKATSSTGYPTETPSTAATSSAQAAPEVDKKEK